MQGFDRPALIVGGNLYGVKPEAGRYDASIGTVLELGPNREITALSSQESGLHVEGQIRQIVPYNDTEFVILRNNQEALNFIQKNE